jgi:predicted permease
MPNLLRRVWNTIRRQRIDDDLRQEIETHLACIEEAERAQGASAEQARRAARERFGQPSLYRERAVDAVIATSAEALLREIVFAARRLARSPAFAVASVLTLALAIGANTAIFAVVERVIINPLPYPDADRLVQLDHGSQRLNVANGFGLTPGLYYQYAERAHTLQSVAIYQTDGATLTGDGDPSRIRIVRVTPSLEAVTGVAPALGRWFSDADGVPGAAPVAVLSHGLWMRRYSGEVAVLGRLVFVGGLPTRVVGVMPASYDFPDARVDLWVPVQLARAQGFGLWGYQGVARLRDGATIAEARRELAGLITDVPRAFPGDLGALGNVETNLIAIVRSLKDAIVGGIEKALWALLAAVGVVLLIACANVTNLFLVRSEVRHREIAIRHALGAGRLGIARFFVAEGLLLSAAGGVLGSMLAWSAVGLLVRHGPTTLPRLREIRLDAATGGFALALSTVVALTFSTIAVWHSRAVTLPAHDSGRANTVTRSRHRIRQLLMGTQVALALVLLAASALIARSFQNVRAIDPGFDPRSAITFSIGLPDRDYPTREAAVAVHQAILDGVRELPGVTAASSSTCLPLAGGCFGNTVRVRGRRLAAGAVPPVALFRAVAADYFETMRMRLRRGRTIDREDIDRKAPVVVVDQTLADRFFPNEDPIGQYVASNRAPKRAGEEPELAWREIVGVVASTPVFTLVDVQPLPQMYMPMSIAAPQTGAIRGASANTDGALVGPNIAVMNYVVRTAGEPAALLAAVRHVADTVDRSLALAQVETLQQIVDRSSAQMAFTMVLLSIAAAVALSLGLIGIYGVTSYLVTQRTAEIGVRLALGAEPRSVTRMIVSQGALVAGVGIAVGLGAAIAGSRVIESLLYRVSPRDPLVFVATSTLLFSVALAACWLPARRAARLNPADTLRM